MANRWAMSMLLLLVEEVEMSAEHRPRTSQQRTAR
jgi:hypothetical protein